ncbi:hypothetical protein GGE07_005472 [Sinorhizobium terangae]|nr:hypothetical protein [Sinorhizobium terangae]
MSNKTIQDWEVLAERELKASPEKLVWETPEGIAIKPLYTGDDLNGMPTFLPGQA